MIIGAIAIASHSDSDITSDNDSRGGDRRPRAGGRRVRGRREGADGGDRRFIIYIYIYIYTYIYIYIYNKYIKKHIYIYIYTHINICCSMYKGDGQEPGLLRAGGHLQHKK